MEILVLAGADEAEAADVTDVLVWADRRDQAPQGTIWLDAITERLVRGDTISPAPIEVQQPYRAARTIDAGHGLGHVAACRATEWAGTAAMANGIAVATIRDSGHFGACGYYAAKLAQRGLIGIAATNAYPKVAPHGGAEAVLGTNPIAFAAPVLNGDPIIADLSTGSTAGSRIRAAQASGEPLDHGAALDRSGQPTRDPHALQDGGVMLPFGGPKGGALGLMIEVLTSGLAGGAPPDALGSMFAAGHTRTSHVVIAIAANDELSTTTSHLRDLITAAAPQEGQSIRIPGDRGHRAAANDTISLRSDTALALRNAATRVGVDLDESLS